MAKDNQETSVSGSGNGPIDAFFQGLRTLGYSGYQLISYDEHALEEGSDSSAVAYIRLKDPQDRSTFGVGIAPNISMASLQALINAVNRLQRS